MRNDRSRMQNRDEMKLSSELPSVIKLTFSHLNKLPKNTFCLDKIKVRRINILIHVNWLGL